MTQEQKREEEIWLEAKQFQLRFHGNDRQGRIANAAFIEGAQWADKNPSKFEGISIEEDEELINKARQEHLEYHWDMFVKSIQSKFVDKACEWLQENCAIIWESPCNPDKVVEQFRKAMEQ